MLDAGVHFREHPGRAHKLTAPLTPTQTPSTQEHEFHEEGQFGFLLIADFPSTGPRANRPVPSLKAQDAAAQAPSRFAKWGSPSRSKPAAEPTGECLPALVLPLRWEALSKIKTPHPPVYLLLQPWLVYKN